MKLTEQQLYAGRECLRKGSLVKFREWLEENRIQIDVDETCRTFGHLLAAPEGETRAIVLFNRVFVGMDPVADRAKAWARLIVRVAIFVTIALGCVGGIVYLLRSCLL